MSIKFNLFTLIKNASTKEDREKSTKEDREKSTKEA
jgi:hypothetical protein